MSQKQTDISHGIFMKDPNLVPVFGHWRHRSWYKALWDFVCGRKREWVPGLMDRIVEQQRPFIGDSIALREPDLTPLTCMSGHPGYPVRSNVIEVNGHYKRIKKWIGGRLGLLDRLSEDQPAIVTWFEELDIGMEADNGQETQEIS